MTINDAFRVISQGCYNLEHHIWLSIMLLESSIMILESSIMLLDSSIMHLESSIMLLESSIMLLESSIMLLKNIHSAGITHADHHMPIVICLQYWPHDYFSGQSKIASKVGATEGSILQQPLNLQVHSLTCIHQTSLEKLISDKHSRLFYSCHQ